MIHYIIQTIGFQLFFLIVYDLFLKKETFFNWNRVYLLGTTVLSLVLPLIKIDSLKNVLPQQYIFSFQKINLNSGMVILDDVTIGTEVSKSFWTLENLFLMGVIATAVVFIIKLFRVFKLIRNNPKQKLHNLLLVALINSKAAFSFFNYVFIGEKIEAEERKSILEHEIIHIKQKHTLDLLFFELLRVVFWFNPLVYLYQNRISDLHEFIADSKAVKLNKKQYYENLLSQVFDTNAVSFINPFFKKSLIKKRIIMLQKSKSKQTQLIKYALLVPIVLGMLIYSSCSEESTQLVEEEREVTISDRLNELKVLMADKELSEQEKQKLKEIYIQALEDNSDNVISVSPIPNKVIEGYEKLPNDYNEVPFAVIDQAPIFPGCELAPSEKDKKTCMNIKLNEFITKNFNTNLAKDLGVSGVQQIRAMFKISNDGTIKDINVRAANPELKAEAIRVISMLPTMIPGEHDGKKVSVPYYLPIKFQANE